MPHVSDGGGVDLSSSDEIKVFEVEGEGEDEERSSSENLKEVKNSLIAEGSEEEEKIIQIPSHQSFISSSKNSQLPNISPLTGKNLLSPSASYGYLPFPHQANGTLGPFPLHRVPMVPPNHVSSSFPLMVYPHPDGVQPPPAHMGIPPLHIDPKTGEMRVPDSVTERWRKDFTGFHRPSLYPFPSTGQYFCTDLSQQLQWPHSSMYHTFRPPAYPGTVQIPSSMSTKFPPTLLPHHHPGLSPSISHHPLLVSGTKLEMPDSQDNMHLSPMNHFNHHQSNNHNVNNTNSSNSSAHHPSPSESSNSISDSSSRSRSEKKKSHIKKPLNAFMMYMKEMRPQVQAECTLKESAAINQILGRKWHNLSREEQSKYYDMAKEARLVHQQMYPGWSARDNYAINAKKKKKTRNKSQDGDGNNPKKCRARFGLDQQSSWCKPCRRKKKCIRYTCGSDNAGELEENIGSVESVGSEAATPDSRFDANTSHLSDDDSGNAESNSSEYNSLSSPPNQLLSPPVPRPLDNVQSVLENGKHIVGSPPSQQIHHPLNVQHLSRSSGHQQARSPEVNLPQLPTPPSTDSSTTTAVGLAIT